MERLICMVAAFLVVVGLLAGCAQVQDGATTGSVFKGATPANDYTPDEPFTLVVESNPYSDANDGYKKLFVRSGGADNPREIVLRRRGDGKWFLWDQFILVGIREPKSADPWA